MQMKRYRMFWGLVVCLCMQLQAQIEQVPAYLKEYKEVYAQNPRVAALKWFKEAKFGMMISFSPASQLSGGTKEWIQTDEWHREKKQYEGLNRYARNLHLHRKFTEVSPRVEQLIRSFRPEHFNADSIAEVAVQAGMKYITFTTHHVLGRMFMFDTSLSPWNSQNMLHRDFVKELADACEKRGLGLCLYVAPPNDHIHQEMKVMLRELLTNYGSIAAIWFDGIGECYRHPNEFVETGHLYQYVRQLQPQCLVSFKTGFTGDEDFLAPEWSQVKFDEKNTPLFNINVPTEQGESLYAETLYRPVVRIYTGTPIYVRQNFKQVWVNELSEKPVELCNPMLKGQEWFDVKDGVHKTAAEIREEYDYTRSHHANYLLNVALRGDGSIHPLDKNALKEFGNTLQ